MKAKCQISAKNVYNIKADDLSLIKELRFQKNRNICHIFVVLMDMKPSLLETCLPSFLSPDFNFLSQDQFGFTSLTYAIAYVL